MYLFRNQPSERNVAQSKATRPGEMLAAARSRKRSARVNRGSILTRYNTLAARHHPARLLVRNDGVTVSYANK